MMPVPTLIDVINFLIKNLGVVAVQKFGLLGLFIVAILPISFIPREVVMAPLIAGGVSLYNIIAVVTIGGTFRSLIIYGISRAGYQIGTNTKSWEVRFIRKLHHYKHLVFFASPFIFIGGDLIMIIAGVENIKLRTIAPALVAGQLVRSVIAVYFTSVIVQFFTNYLHMSLTN